MRYKNQSKDKSNGVVYTPKEMASYIAYQMVNSGNLHEFKEKVYVLDPAIGDGELSVAIINELTKKKSNIQIELYGYDIDENALLKSLERIKKFPNVHLNLFHEDFLNISFQKDLLEKYLPPFDFVIANPPYVRTQALDENMSKRLSSKFNLKGKVDLYYAFLILSFNLLKEGGTAGFITSNKYLTISSGKSIRKFLSENSEIMLISDFGDTRVFEAAVLPCVTVFMKKNPTKEYKVRFNNVYLNTDRIKDSELFKCSSVYDCIGKRGYFIDGNGIQFKAKTGYCVLNNQSSLEPWVISDFQQDEELNRIKENTWRTFGEIGKIRVGIKTTADNVFLFNKEAALVNMELVKPLITHRNANFYYPDNTKKWSVLYPHFVINGKKQACDINNFPKAKTYLQQHFNQLDGRKYLKEAGRKWYEIWVTQDPSAWSHRKIVFRDISELPQFWYVDSEAVINGDCYWIDFEDNVPQDLIYLILAVANSEFILHFYDKKFNTKLYSSKRRFMKQYVEKFPIPDPNKKESKEVIDLVKDVILTRTLPASTKQKINSLISKAFN